MSIQLYNGDCFDILPNIESNSVDMVFCDLPYGQTVAKFDVKIDLSRLWVELKRVGKDRCVYAFTCTTRFGHELISSNPCWFRYDLVWAKTRPIMFFQANKMSLRSHEMIYIFYPKLPT